MISDFLWIAGPCAMEEEQSYLDEISYLKKLNIKYVRAPIYKMRTRHDRFQGLGKEGLRILSLTKKYFPDLSLVTEITDPRQLDGLLSCVDVFQVGSRNMHNTELLKELSRISKTVLLKRSFMATYEEWYHAASYILNSNPNLWLCERGIRTFETGTRNTLDLAAIFRMKEKLKVPVIIDPSHGSGDSKLVLPLARAAAAFPCDGLMIETHPNPKKSLCDADQAVSLEEFSEMKKQIDHLRSSLQNA